jgi:hypothetical protein
MQITEHESLAFLDAILDSWPGWRLATEPEIEWATEGQARRRTELNEFVVVRVKL